MIVDFQSVLLFLVLTILALSIFQSRITPWKILLLTSLLIYFIIAKLAAIFILFYSAYIFLCGRLIEKSKSRFANSIIVFLGLLPLLIYKIGISLLYDDEYLIVILGISYATFNGLSYLLDIKKGYVKSEKNYWLILLYLCFFPTISAGPLHRYKLLSKQFKESIKLSNENFSAGFRLILWGSFKNFVLAQRLKIIVDTILNAPESYTGGFVLIGGFAFFLQIYCNFSSYVDIAQGASKCFGIRLNTNFNSRVYAAPSRYKFWQGWNITLNSWFRDYFFFAITKHVKTKWKINLAILSTFILIGLWHGIAIQFLIWGLLNGIWIVSETYFNPFVPSFPGKKYVGILYHIIIASVIALIFRSNDLWATLEALFSSSAADFVDNNLIKQTIFIIPFFFIMDYIYQHAGEIPVEEFMGRMPLMCRWGLYFLLVLSISIFGIIEYEPYYIKF